MGDTEGSRPATMSELEDLCENIHSPPLYLWLEVLQLKGDDAAYAASHIGVCKGLLACLQSVSPSPPQVGSPENEYTYNMLHIYIWVYMGIYIYGCIYVYGYICACM